MTPPPPAPTKPQADAPPPSPHSSDPAALEVVARMRAHNPKADPLGRLPDVHPSRIPRHIAIIMDGNGRWAEARGFPRLFGHRNGAAAVRETVEECGRLGVECLTLYSFSSENWKRSRDEVDALMALCVMYVQGERDALNREGVRFRVIGRREGLPPEVVAAIDETERSTQQNRAATLCLAINYGSRDEIVNAARSLARDAKAGTLDPDAIDADAIASRLWTADLPDPDLLIRTAGERRISNFLLWQISYAELYVTDALWPDFGVAELHRAVRDYASRERRFGGV
ncbi:MAG: isoprenyl transferase [Phycisphaerales bacterium]